MTDGLVRILEGNTFVVSDKRGDIEASATDPAGLFSFDTRFLSKWVLTVNGQRLNSLSTDDLHYYEARFFLVPGTGTVYVDAKLSVIRVRAVGDGFHEKLSILNHEDKPVELQVRLDANSDFADLFEVKDALEKKGTYRNRVEPGRLVLGYQRETYERATLISATQPAQIDKDGLTFNVRIEPHGQWTTEFQVVTDMGALEAALPDIRGRPSMARGLEKWVGKAPRLESSVQSLKAAYQRSIVDLAALRFSPAGP
jgi:glycogen debranching enzyme